MDQHQYFAACRNIEELRQEYWRLLRLYHPDKGGDSTIMQQINAEYETALEWFRRGAASNQNPKQEEPPSEESKNRKVEVEEPLRNEGSKLKSESIGKRKKIWQIMVACLVVVVIVAGSFLGWICCGI